MAYRNILIIVDPSEDAEARIDAAVTFAGMHRAQLIGLHVGIAPPLPPIVATQFSEPARRALMESARKTAQDAEKQFRERTEDRGIHTAWRHVEGDAAALASLHARYADVVIAGQPNPKVDEPDARAHFLAHLIMAAGRPVLVVPHAARPERIGDRVLVAWNASREAARALYDALPILEKANEVLVVSVNPAPGGPSRGPYASHDIAHNLLAHGVKAHHERVAEYDKGAGEVLLSRAVDYGADLVVMGAYGHTRFREIILGGATRHVLHHATLPVLVSH